MLCFAYWLLRDLYLYKLKWLKRRVENWLNLMKLHNSILLLMASTTDQSDSQTGPVWKNRYQSEFSWLTCLLVFGRFTSQPYHQLVCSQAPWPHPITCLYLKPSQSQPPKLSKGLDLSVCRQQTSFATNGKDFTVVFARGGLCSKWDLTTLLCMQRHVEDHLQRD